MCAAQADACLSSCTYHYGALTRSARLRTRKTGQSQQVLGFLIGVSNSLPAVQDHEHGMATAKAQHGKVGDHTPRQVRPKRLAQLVQLLRHIVPHAPGLVLRSSCPMCQQQAMSMIMANLCQYGTNALHYICLHASSARYTRISWVLNSDTQHRPP